jgi:cytochrome P450
VGETVGSDPVRLGEEFMQDPHAVARRLGEAACPVVLPTQVPGWLVTSYEDARQLLADSRVSKDVKRGLGQLPQAGSFYGSKVEEHMLNSDPPEHTRLRRLVGKVFTARAVERLRPRIERAADELLDALPAGRTVDLVGAYALPLSITVICELLGVPAADQQDFRRWAQTSVSVAPLEEKAEDRRAMIGYLADLIERKTVSPADDLLSELLHASDEGSRLTAEETVGMAFLLLVAGFDTTVNLIGNGVLALLRHPDQMALLRAQPSLLPAAIEEILRFDGPVNVTTFRFTTEPVAAGQAEIPAGELVHISLLAANRDCHRFSDPDTFDITRKGPGHIAFGHGVHHCLGAPLARLEGQIAIERLLSRFPHIALGTDPGSLRRENSVLIHGLTSLPVRIGS